MNEHLTDLELVGAANPPRPLADVFLRQAEADTEALLDLLFCCHNLVDDPEQEDGPWHNSDIAFFVKRWYLNAQVPPALKDIAPTWDDAVLVAEQWLQSWPHDCGEFEYWAYRRDEMEDPTAIGYMRSLLQDRASIPCKK
jgi:hypothetical protein